MSQLFGSPKENSTPKKIRVFSSHRGSAGNAEVRRIFHSARPTWSQVPRRFFFFSKLMKKPWIKAVVFGDFEKHVHMKKGSYKHMQVEPLASVFDLYQNHTMVPFGPTYPTSCLVPFQVTRSVSRGQVFLYQLYTGLFRVLCHHGL